jgi:hypothetical protein
MPDQMTQLERLQRFHRDVRAILKDDAGEWRELSSCADAIEAITGALSEALPDHPGAPDPGAWALYLHTTKYSIDGISLHHTRRDALIAALAYVETERDATDEATIAAMDDDELYDLVSAKADEYGDEWSIEATDLPALPVATEEPHP